MTLRILVTGANKGIGLAICRGILEQQQDASVLLGARDAERGAAARAALVNEHPEWEQRVQVVELDVSSDASVSAAAKRVTAPLYAVVNNAGIGESHGLAAVLEVNTLGVRRVCEAFLPLLDPKQGRIVNVTSASGPNFVNRCSPERQRFFVNPNVEWAEIDAVIQECLALSGPEAFAAAGLGDGNAYGLSKALGNSYTLLLARQHPNLRINSCTPGFIETDMTRGYAKAQGKSPTEMGMKQPADGARTPLFLLFGEPEGNGRYYGSDAQRSPLDRYRSPGSEPYRGD